MTVYPRAFTCAAVAGLLLHASIGYGAQNTPAASAAAQSFVVTGAVDTKLSLTVPSIQQRFGTQLSTVTYTLKGVQHTAQIVPLEAIVEAASPKINPHAKHAMLQDVVTVTGQDGYTVVFSWGELLPDFGNEKVWVAVDKDGKPLSADEGPVELIVPGDNKAARWVHAVASIEVAALGTS